MGLKTQVKFAAEAYPEDMKKITAVMLMTVALSISELYAHADQPDWARNPDAVALMQSAQGLKPAAAQAAMTMSESIRLAPVKELKRTLTDQEKKKFIELAKYAQKLTNVKIAGGWLFSARHDFQLRGNFAADGSYNLDGFILQGGFSDTFQFQISSDGLVDKSIGSFIGARYNLESLEVQEMLSKEIAFWMSYKIPQ